MDASQVGRAWDSQWSVSSVASGKRMLGEVSLAVSPAPLSLDMTVTCTSGVVPMSAQPPAVTSILAMSTATITSPEIDVNTGSSDVDPVPRLGPVSTSMGESVPAVELSSPPLSDQPDPVPVGESMPDVELSSPSLSDQPDPVPVVESVPAVDSSSSPLSGPSSPASSQTLAWGQFVPQLCSGGALPGRSGGGQFVSCVAGFAGICVSAIKGCSAVSAGWGTVADDVGRFQ